MLKLADLPDFQYSTNRTLKSFPFKICVHIKTSGATDLCNFKLISLLLLSLQLLKLFFTALTLTIVIPIESFPCICILSSSSLLLLSRPYVTSLKSVSLALSFMSSVFQWSHLQYMLLFHFFPCLPPQFLAAL